MELIKVGLCAFGMSGKVFHAPFINEHPGFTLTGIVERHKKDSVEKYPNATIYKSVEALLENKEISLVIINTPVQTHFEYAKKALESGKNIIVEKPFTVNESEAIELNKLAKEKKLFISVYQNRRFDRDFLQTKKIIESGVLGNLKEVEIRFDRFRTEPSGKIHKENPSLEGSGALHDLGAHLIDQAIQLFGVPESVFGDVFSMKGEQTANDYFEILMYYPNDFRLRIKSSVLIKEDHYAYKIFGDKGCFLQERTDNQEAELVSGSIPEYGIDWQIPLKQADSILNYNNDLDQNIRIELTSEPGNYMNYYQQIYEHQVFGYPIPSPAAEIIDVMKTIDLALKSSKERRVLDSKS